MHAVLASNAFDAKKVLRKVTKGTWTNKGCTIDPCSLATAAGVAFTTLHRMEGSTQGFGNGFVLARSAYTPIWLRLNPPPPSRAPWGALLSLTLPSVKGRNWQLAVVLMQSCSA